MHPMPLVLAPADIAARLAVCLVAGLLIGLNRGESGKAAGLRTTVLVCLTACLAMLQVNALLAQTGKAAQSFAVLDLMRLPLGILSGMGFIGAGAILRRGGFVTGLTTAATLWFVTMIGLCAGGGQLGLAALGTVLGFGVLAGLKPLEQRLPHRRHAWLSIDETRGTAGDTPRTRAMLDRLAGLRCRTRLTGTQCHAATGAICRRFELAWVARAGDDPVEHAIDAFVRDSHGGASWSVKE
ncbi:MgtC/SapB family protein [Burkholderia sp. Ac-20379]|uniref:MgtC/SapB family protein n=1 Tax=Burkholderia sp. Ac-20379 TaxID=2703900 RepID=UPI00197D49EF|nr:MgtC/SapB family protein [Burkholderia sp. Ac-20379]MBN3723924.1 MgtC/SapB family protein [Burkholderia sp. Ac-20379]